MKLSQSSALSNDFQTSVSMAMAVSSNEKDITATMLKSVVHIGSPPWLRKRGSVNARNRNWFH